MVLQDPLRSSVPLTADSTLIMLLGTLVGLLDFRARHGCLPQPHCCFRNFHRSVEVDVQCRRV